MTFQPDSRGSTQVNVDGELIRFGDAFVFSTSMDVSAIDGLDMGAIDGLEVGAIHGQKS